MTRTKQNGSALITAIFITAMCAIIATAMLMQQRLFVHQSQLANGADASYLYLDGLRAQAQENIELYERAWQNHSDHDVELMLNKIIASDNVPGISLRAELQDQQGLFNINKLVNPNNKWQFIRLLSVVVPELSHEQQKMLANAVVSWMSPEQSNEKIYHERLPPMRQAHQPLFNITTLRQIEGVTPKIYNRLRPFITALPRKQYNTGININSASAPVLMTLSQHITYDEAKAMVACIKGHVVIRSKEDFNKLCVAPLGLFGLNDISVYSNFFLLRSVAKRQDQMVQLSSFIMSHQGQDNKIRTRIIWQSLGGI